MKLAEITTAMQAYAAQCNANGASQMTLWYNQGNMFCYARDVNNTPIPPATKAYVHVYFGIDSQGALKVFVISANKDVSTNSNIENDIQVCGVSMVDPSPNGTNNGGISNKTALDQILLWKNTYPAWIGANIGSSTSIFKAFRVPQSDTSFGTQHNGFLSLTLPTSSNPSKADIVVQDTQSSVVEYYDTARPVPPFPSTGFYLFTLAGT